MDHILGLYGLLLLLQALHIFKEIYIKYLKENVKAVDSCRVGVIIC
jgi:hypothetical protein